MPNDLKALRTKAARGQNWSCYYCDMPMWDHDISGFANRIGLSRRVAMGLKCTAEHLQARSDGGDDCLRNIVAACLTCNRRRHLAKQPKSPEMYRRHVQSRVKQGRWHPCAIIASNFGLWWKDHF